MKALSLSESIPRQVKGAGPGDTVLGELSDTVLEIACPSYACHPILYGIWVTFYVSQCGLLTMMVNSDIIHLCTS